MNKKIKILISMIVILGIPGLVLADNNSYNTIQNVSTALINVIQWFGYAIAVRSTYICRYKVCYEWCE